MRESGMVTVMGVGLGLLLLYLVLKNIPPDPLSIGVPPGASS